MKLRNKKTGEIVELDHFSMHYSYHYDYGKNARGEQPCSTWNVSLAELNEEWEDVPEEEPKTFWAISWAGEPEEYDTKKTPQELKDMAKEIGNYFETKEEAERVVDKLLAWKRLKETGCELIKWKWRQDYPSDACYVEGILRCKFDSGVHDKELDLLFSQESKR